MSDKHTRRDQPTHPTQPTRRTFIKYAVSGASGVAAFPLALPPLLRAASPNSKLNVAGIGAGGKGYVDISETANTQSANIVALCDVDLTRLNKTAQQFPRAKKYDDYRKLLEQNDIEAVIVSTPDHTHAPAALAAMGLGKHLYCQKPLAHSLHETRQITRAAKESGVTTQMGIQLHSSTRIKMGVEYFKQGAIGKVREVHAWTDRPIWPQGIGRPDGSDPVPDSLKWDQWIGTAPHRPYVQGVYHPFNWRGWVDFGTGALGDMGCHIFDPVHWALDLDAPTTLRSEGDAPNGETFPNWSIIHYQFPGNRHTTADTLNLTWYDGGKQPPRDILKFPADWNIPKNGAVLIGEKGNLFVAFDAGPYLLPRDKFEGHPRPDVQPDNHYAQWVHASAGNGQTSAPIDTYSGPLTETVLLGNVALHFPGQTLEWDAKNFQFTNHNQANNYLQ